MARLVPRGFVLIVLIGAIAGCAVPPPEKPIVLRRRPPPHRSAVSAPPRPVTAPSPAPQVTPPAEAEPTTASPTIASPAASAAGSPALSPAQKESLFRDFDRYLNKSEADH